MAVRNWWIEADIDGRQTTLEGGPRNKSGGFEMAIYQRHQGEILRVGTIVAKVYGENLILSGHFNEGEIQVTKFQVTTQR